MKGVSLGAQTRVEDPPVFAFTMERRRGGLQRLLWGQDRETPRLDSHTVGQEQDCWEATAEAMQSSSFSGPFVF